MRKYLLTIFLLLSGFSLLAQNNCERSLNEARSDYSNGNLYAIPGKLADCLVDGFLKSEKIEAYRLLTLTYLNINQNEKAKESLIKLLKIKTDYKVLPNVDPPELYSLYRKIKTDPIYFIGIVGLMNFNTIQVLKGKNGDLRRFSQNPYKNKDSYRYTPKISFQVGAQFIYPFSEKLWLRGDVMYQNQKYDYSETIVHNTEAKDNTFTYESSDNGLNLNVSARGILDKYYWKPFMEIGITGRYNINQLLLNYVSEDSEELEEGNADRIDISMYRKKFNFGLHAHIGTMFMVGENYGEIKIGATKYMLAHTNYLDDNQRILQTVDNRGEVIEDDFSNLIYEVNIAFNIPFFNFR
ncbi:outer membrane beta-barrel protein [Marivirga sp. S37H4]|uniref:Outer membrane beta-barrel protein n=1 Tax=Marivirga aurantiaca TaxID=2802615 RepID=A0A934X0M8_9BACT|nr:outer membrane beta-barrel protein [Marivirga aurantiaca]MBK6266235.1 outer membrane beta-barrel protein [Marivirga aurantiaca]